MRPLHRSAAPLLILLATSMAGPAAAQDTVSNWVREHYTQTDVMIPMRDGVRLFTTIYAPRDTAGTYPVLFTRTPYATDTFLQVLGPGPTYGAEGFIFAYQDVRGKYQSEGEFVNIRPFNPKKTGTQVDEASDTYDTIDWLVKNVRRNNGKVAQFGVSYLGFYTTMGILSGHPALVAASPQAPVTDWFIGDDFHHNGAFFVGDAFAFLSGFGKPRPAPTRAREHGYQIGTPDGYAFMVEAGALPNLNTRYLKGGIPFWNELMQHPNYDAWWQARSPLQYLKGVRPAVMVVGGLFDAEDLWGTVQTYRAIEKQNPGASNMLVLGPWFHGQWWFDEGSALGDQQWGSATSTWYHENVELPFYNCYLKGRCDRKLAEAYVFETGANQWRTFDSWPPAAVTPVSMYFGRADGLSRQAPAAAAGFDEYVSDPNHPVPYVDGLTGTRYRRDYMLADQRFAWRRPDVLSYETEPLTEDVTIAGEIRARLFVSTTGTDADWVVKLIDVYPDDMPDPKPNPTGARFGGYQQLVRAEIMRGRYRNSFEKPQAFVPGKVTKVEVVLPDALHTFRKGHRIMVQVQSSWFPLADRNPQTFVDIYQAKDSDFRKATHRVYRGGNTGSVIVLPVLPGGAR